MRNLKKYWSWLAYKDFVNCNPARFMQFEYVRRYSKLYAEQEILTNRTYEQQRKYRQSKKA
jgi:hypothetical protein